MPVAFALEFQLYCLACDRDDGGAEMTLEHHDEYAATWTCPRCRHRVDLAWTGVRRMTRPASV